MRKLKPAASARMAESKEAADGGFGPALRDCLGVLDSLIDPDMSESAGDVYFRAVAAACKARLELKGKGGS